MMKKQSPYPISIFWWFYLPIAVFIALFLARQYMPHFTLTIVDGENGIVELAQFFILVLGVFASIRVIIEALAQQKKMILGWASLAFFGCLYVALEEVSYGQHFFGWEANEFWQTHNDQNETNLHNTSSWLDQKPRLILEIGIIVGGIIIPLLRRFKPSALPVQFKDLYPASILFICALLAELAHAADALKTYFDFRFFGRNSEVQELYYFYFVLLYLILLRKDLIKAKEPKTSEIGKDPS